MPLRVLVVDDDDAGRYLVAAIVSSAGHEAIQAMNGQEALALARESAPDIVLTDILMPVMDGYQLAREWKSDATLGSIPLVFMTASYNDPADEAFATELGADEFLSKPVDSDVLLDVIARLTSGESAQVRRPAERTEVEVLRDYSDRVAHKLEQKLVDLEQANSLLESAMAALSDEVDARGRLIEELGVEVTERKQRELELQRERDFTASIVETADVFISVTDLEGRVTLFSPGAERMSGYSSSEVLGRNFIDLFAPPDDRDRRVEIRKAVIASGGARGVVNTWVMRSGEERVFEWSLAPLNDPSGETTGLLGFAVDVTDRVVSTATDRTIGVVDLAVLLDRPQSQLLDMVCAQAADEFGLAAVWVGLKRSDGQIEVSSAAGAVSPQLGEFFAQHPGDACLIGAVDDLVEARETTVAQMDQDAPCTRFALENATQAAFAAPIRAHGEVLGLVGALSFTPRGFGAGRSRGLQHLADRLGVALAYAEARSQLNLRSAALESAASAVLVVRASGHVGWVNNAFESMTGWKQQDVAGSHLFEGPGYTEPRYRDAWQQVIAGTPWRSELRNTTRDGVEYVEDVTISPVRSGDGQVTHAVIVKQDVSERVRFEELKSDFLAMVSHELRTPLTTIIGYADLLGASIEALPIEKVRAATESIRSSGRRMKSIVEQLLEVTQIQAEGVVIETVPREIGPFVEEISRGFELDDKHRLHLEIEDELPALDIDARRLALALRNMLDNAVKYSPEGGSVGVAVHNTGTEVVIAVSDEGVGIAADQIPDLFEAFHQRDMTSTRSFGGVGLGLFVAHQFVSAHGGHITVRSREGHGSTFEIRLPHLDLDDQVADSGSTEGVEGAELKVVGNHGSSAVDGDFTESGTPGIEPTG